MIPTTRKSFCHLLYVKSPLCNKVTVRSFLSPNIFQFEPGFFATKLHMPSHHFAPGSSLPHSSVHSVPLPTTALSDRRPVPWAAGGP